MTSWGLRLRLPQRARGQRRMPSFLSSSVGCCKLFGGGGGGGKRVDVFDEETLME